MGLSVRTASTGEPLEIQELRDHLRVSSTEEDVLIENLVPAARQMGERKTNRSFMDTDWRLTLDEFPRSDKPIEMPRSPLTSSTSVSVTYVPSSGGGAVTFNSTNYVVRGGGDYDHPAVVLKDDKTWPTETLQAADGVRVDWTAGYGQADDVPRTLKQALLLTVGHWYEHRESVVIGSVATEIPQAAESLLLSYKVPDVG